MSTETFLRLPEEKRNRVLEAAWTEFTRVNFSQASINQIIQRAGIPRGSFYQYFQDKEDLFQYLIEQMHTLITASYRQLIDTVKGNLFQAQMVCYDQFFRPDYQEKPAVDRFIRILQINPGMDIQKMMPEQPGDELINDVLERLDTRDFLSKDDEYIRNVFMLTLLALGSAIMDSLAHPDLLDQNRRKLSAQLEIIRRGSTAAKKEEL